MLFKKYYPIASTIEDEINVFFNVRVLTYGVGVRGS